jgi:tRNA(Phe) wybutosine-synthesizing methylase Tyw3
LKYINFKEKLDLVVIQDYLWYFFDPPVLKFTCTDLSTCKQLLDLSVHAGLKYGLLIPEKKLIIIRSTEKIFFPIKYGKTLLVSVYYLRNIFKYTKTRIKKLKDKLNRFFTLLQEFQKEKNSEI